MSSPVETMKQLLDGLYEEVEEKKSEVRREGRVSSDFCDLCYSKRWDIVPLTSQQQKTMEKLIEWANKFEIISIQRAEAYLSHFEIKSKKQITKGSRRTPEEQIYKYTWRLNDTKSPLAKEMGKIRGLKTLFRSHSIEACPHTDKDNLTAVRIQNLYPHLSFQTEMYSIFIGCEECISLKNNTRCNSIFKDGFLYKFSCPFTDMIIRQRAEKMGLTFDTGERERRYSVLTFTEGIIDRAHSYYFRELDVFLNYRWRTIGETIKLLKPSLLVLLAPHTALPDFLEYDTNVLFYDEDGFYLYDKDREVEQDTSVICDRIISDLNQVMDGLRGNDHDRTISALDRIGSSMGYVPKTEFSQPGVRIDLVWYDREGKIQVACEVETSSTWKKDLTSTWEVEPRLAIIVGFTKTDRVAKNLMSITLMKYVPHPLLYINKVTGNAFLFEKNNLIKGYELKTVEPEKEDDIKIL